MLTRVKTAMGQSLRGWIITNLNICAKKKASHWMTIFGLYEPQIQDPNHKISLKGENGYMVSLQGLIPSGRQDICKTILAIEMTCSVLY